MKQKLALDSEDGRVPWTVPQPRFARQGSLMLFAIARSLKGGRPNRGDNPHWFANVPPTFFK